MLFGDLLSLEEDWANAPVIAVPDHVKSLPEQLRGQTGSLSSLGPMGSDEAIRGSN